MAFSGAREEGGYLGLRHATSRHAPRKNLIGTLIADIVLQILSFVAQKERENIRQRQAEGIAAAKARGVRFGRTPLVLPDNFEAVLQLWQNKHLTDSEAARLCGMARSTFRYRAEKFKKN